MPMLRWIKKKFTTVMELRDDKASIAGGVAIGMFWGLSPLFGLKTVLAFLTAWVTRRNKIAAVVGVTFHDVLLPFYPLFADWGYKIGCWIMREQHPLRMKKILSIVTHRSEWWTYAHHLVSLFIGTTLISIPIAIGTYFLTAYAIDRLAKQQARELAAAYLQHAVDKQHEKDAVPKPPQG